MYLSIYLSICIACDYVHTVSFTEICILRSSTYFLLKHENYWHVPCYSYCEWSHCVIGECMIHLLLIQGFWTFIWLGADGISIALVLEEIGWVFRTICNGQWTEVTKWLTRWNPTENPVTFWTRGLMPQHCQSVWKMEYFGKRCGTVEDTFLRLWSSSDISRIAEVRCTKLFGFRANSPTNFAMYC